MMLAHIPGSSNKCRNQSTGKNSARLQGRDAENFAGMVLVRAPVIDDVQDLGSDNAAEHHQNAEIPRVVAVVSHALGIAHADPKPDQDSHRDQESIRRQEELTDMKKLWEHCSVGCANPQIRYCTQFNRNGRMVMWGRPPRPSVERSSTFLMQ